MTKTRVKISFDMKCHVAVIIRLEPGLCNAFSWWKVAFLQQPWS